jgi:serine/threonine protein kinase
MAPEVLEKSLYNYKADIWSLGVLLFEMITNEPPFTASNKKELKANIKKGLYKIPNFIKVNKKCLDFIHCCLQYDQ